MERSALQLRILRSECKGDVRPASRIASIKTRCVLHFLPFVTIYLPAFKTSRDSCPNVLPLSSTTPANVSSFPSLQTLLDAYKRKKESHCGSTEKFCDKGASCVPTEKPCPSVSAPLQTSCERHSRKRVRNTCCSESMRVFWCRRPLITGPPYPLQVKHECKRETPFRCQSDWTCQASEQDCPANSQCTSAGKKTLCPDGAPELSISRAPGRSIQMCPVTAFPSAPC
jgi:hypothetical protein